MRYRPSKQQQKLLREWKRLPDQERSELLPSLLASMDGWEGWSLSQKAFLMWMREKFERVGKAFVGEAPI